MSNDVEELVLRIVEHVQKCYGSCSHMIQPVEIGQESWRNELLLFVKPEAFLVGKPFQAKILNLVFRKLGEFDAHVHGIYIVGGNVLGQKEIMNRHYGLINRLSRTASVLLTDSDRRKIADALGFPSLDGVEVLGGHEYLAKYPGESIYDLDRLWFSKKAVKLRSGFYIQSYDKTGKEIILVNGFHPAQLAHFTDSSRRIVLMLLHSNTSWSTLKNKMVGATFPEKAVSESIRGTIYAKPGEFGLESVTIANNCIHLSAGPFEAMFEIVNFFGPLAGLQPEKQPPKTLRFMMQVGINVREALGTLDNPVLAVAGKAVDLFTATEDMDTETAVALWLQCRHDAEHS